MRIPGKRAPTRERHDAEQGRRRVLGKKAAARDIVAGGERLCRVDRGGIRAALGLQGFGQVEV